MSRTTTRLASVALAVGVALALLAATGGVAAGHTGDDGMHHHDGWMGSHGGGMWAGLGWLWMLGGLLAVLAVPAVVLYALTTRDSGGGGSGGDEALATLRQRYAAGEIDEEEFESRRERLTGGE
ncbi:SHOCT domain-containing protein [Halorientalis pallida]|uniref:SHOCT domain-containing protein n=1 Tax=Halorientalis pallida TaxID=2479928 RepID=UPI003C703014